MVIKKSEMNEDDLQMVDDLQMADDFLASQKMSVPVEFGWNDKLDGKVDMEDVKKGIEAILENVSESLRNNYESVRDKESWDSSTWLAIFKEASGLEIKMARPFYRLFFDRFPSMGRMWKTYAEHELGEKQFEQVQGILSMALIELNLRDTELWKFYLNFIKATKLDIHVKSGDGVLLRKGRIVMQEAYETALDRIGVSVEADQIWMGYINFLKTDKVCVF